SLIRSLAMSMKPSSAASGPASVDFPAAGGPETTTTRCATSLDSIRPGQLSRTPAHQHSSAASPLPLRDFERLAHGPPDRLSVRAFCERLIHCPVAQAGQNVVLSHALGIGLAELRPHPRPELGQPHSRQASPADPTAQPECTGRNSRPTSIRAEPGDV